MSQEKLYEFKKMCLAQAQVKQLTNGRIDGLKHEVKAVQHAMEKLRGEKKAIENELSACSPFNQVRRPPTRIWRAVRRWFCSCSAHPPNLPPFSTHPKCPIPSSIRADDSGQCHRAADDGRRMTDGRASLCTLLSVLPQVKHQERQQARKEDMKETAAALQSSMDEKLKERDEILIEQVRPFRIPVVAPQQLRSFRCVLPVDDVGGVLP